jgi:hypothetical protein
MEQKKVINPELSIWVTDISPDPSSPTSWMLDGIALDGESGFGRLEERVFRGQALFVFATIFETVSLVISEVHSTRHGFFWLVKNVATLPDPPFLITNDLDTKIIFCGEVMISNDHEIFDSSNPRFPAYCVRANKWFGVIYFQEGKTLLAAFSPHKATLVLPGDELWSPEYDEYMGVLEGCKKLETLPGIE